MILNNRLQDKSMKLFIRYPGFFGEQLNRELYELAVSKNEMFSLSKTSYSNYYPEWRKSKVMYDSQFTYFKQTLEQKIRDRLDEIHRLLEIKKFEIDSFEVQLTSHNDGEYFKWHRDNSTPETANRLITFVYYFHSIPKPFSGGELIIYNNETQHVIEPANDSIVIFNSGLRHEVNTIVCPSRLFKDGRFTLNGWIRSKKSLQIDNSHFGYNMFSQAVNSRQKRNS